MLILFIDQQGDNILLSPNCQTRKFNKIFSYKISAPVAQLDRAFDCGSRGQRFKSSQVRFSGEVAEWLKAHAWKACIQQCIGGSNPPLSVAIYDG